MIATCEKSDHVTPRMIRAPILSDVQKRIFTAEPPGYDWP
jgi:hypothetical protein